MGYQLVWRGDFAGDVLLGRLSPLFLIRCVSCRVSGECLWGWPRFSEWSLYRAHCFSEARFGNARSRVVLGNLTEPFVLVWFLFFCVFFLFHIQQSVCMLWACASNLSQQCVAVLLWLFRVVPFLVRSIFRPDTVNIPVIVRFLIPPFWY